MGICRGISVFMYPYIYIYIYKQMYIDRDIYGQIRVYRVSGPCPTGEYLEFGLVPLEQVLGKYMGIGLNSL